MPSSAPSPSFEGPNSHFLQVEGFMLGHEPARHWALTLSYPAGDPTGWEGQLTASLTARRDTTGFWIKGQVDGTLEQVCDTCLESFLWPVHLAVNEQYVLSQFAQTSHPEQELLEDDFFEVIGAQDRLDLADLIRQLLEAQQGGYRRCPLHQ